MCLCVCVCVVSVYRHLCVGGVAGVYLQMVVSVVESVYNLSLHIIRTDTHNIRKSP